MGAAFVLADALWEDINYMRLRATSILIISRLEWRLTREAHHEFWTTELQACGVEVSCCELGGPTQRNTSRQVEKAPLIGGIAVDVPCLLQPWTQNPCVRVEILPSEFHVTLWLRGDVGFGSHFTLHENGLQARRIRFAEASTSLMRCPLPS